MNVSSQRLLSAFKSFFPLGTPSRHVKNAVVPSMAAAAVPAPNMAGIKPKKPRPFNHYKSGSCSCPECLTCLGIFCTIFDEEKGPVVIAQEPSNIFSYYPIGANSPLPSARKCGRAHKRRWESLFKGINFNEVADVFYSSTDSHLADQCCISVVVNDHCRVIGVPVCLFGHGVYRRNACQFSVNVVVSRSAVEEPFYELTSILSRILAEAETKYRYVSTSSNEHDLHDGLFNVKKAYNTLFRRQASEAVREDRSWQQFLPYDAGHYDIEIIFRGLPVVPYRIRFFEKWPSVSLSVRKAKCPTSALQPWYFGVMPLRFCPEVTISSVPVPLVDLGFVFSGKRLSADHHHDLTDMLGRDLVLIQVLKYINGLFTSVEIATLADVDEQAVQIVLQHLVAYDLIGISDVFDGDVSYRLVWPYLAAVCEIGFESDEEARAKFIARGQHLWKNDGESGFFEMSAKGLHGGTLTSRLHTLIRQAGDFIRSPEHCDTLENPLPLSTILDFLFLLSQSSNVFEFMSSYEKGLRTTGIVVRRLIMFGVITGILERHHLRCVLVAVPKPIPVSSKSTLTITVPNVISSDDEILHGLQSGSRTGGFLPSPGGISVKFTPSMRSMQTPRVSTSSLQSSVSSWEFPVFFAVRGLPQASHSDEFRYDTMLASDSCTESSHHHGPLGQSGVSCSEPLIVNLGWATSGRSISSPPLVECPNIGVMMQPTTGGTVSEGNEPGKLPTTATLSASGGGNMANPFENSLGWPQRETRRIVRELAASILSSSRLARRLAMEVNGSTCSPLQDLACYCIPVLWHKQVPWRNPLVMSRKRQQDLNGLRSAVFISPSKLPARRKTLDEINGNFLIPYATGFCARQQLEPAAPLVHSRSSASLIAGEQDYENRFYPQARGLTTEDAITAEFVEGGLSALCDSVKYCLAKIATEELDKVAFFV